MDFKSIAYTSSATPAYRTRLVFFLSSITNFMSVRKSENLLYEPFFILHIYYNIFFYKNQISAAAQVSRSLDLARAFFWWQPRRDLNPNLRLQRATVLETAVLTITPRGSILKQGTIWYLTVLYQLSYSPIWQGRTGLEPTTSGLAGLINELLFMPLSYIIL